MKLHKICNEESYIEYHNYILVDKKNLVATDGLIIVIIPKFELFNIELPELLIRSNDWAKLTTVKQPTFEYKDGYILAYEKTKFKLPKIIIKPLLVAQSGIKFPDYKKLDGWKTKGIERTKVCFNANLIYKLSQAMGSNMLIFTFNELFNGTLVTSNQADFKRRKAIIMEAEIFKNN